MTSRWHGAAVETSVMRSCIMSYWKWKSAGHALPRSSGWRLWRAFTELGWSMFLTAQVQRPMTRIGSSL